MPDEKLAPITIEEFVVLLQALLRRAEDSGLEVEEFCQVAEDILQSGWEG